MASLGEIIKGVGTGITETAKDRLNQVAEAVKGTTKLPVKFSEDVANRALQQVFKEVPFSEEIAGHVLDVGKDVLSNVEIPDDVEKLSQPNANASDENEVAVNNPSAQGGPSVIYMKLMLRELKEIFIELKSLTNITGKQYGISYAQLQEQREANTFAENLSEKMDLAALTGQSKETDSSDYLKEVMRNSGVEVPGDNKPTEAPPHGFLGKVKHAIGETLENPLVAGAAGFAARPLITGAAKAVGTIGATGVGLAKLLGRGAATVAGAEGAGTVAGAVGASEVAAGVVPVLEGAGAVAAPAVGAAEAAGTATALLDMPLIAVGLLAAGTYEGYKAFKIAYPAYQKDHDKVKFLSAMGVGIVDGGKKDVGKVQSFIGGITDTIGDNLAEAYFLLKGQPEMAQIVHNETHPEVTNDKATKSASVIINGQNAVDDKENYSMPARPQGGNTNFNTNVNNNTTNVTPAPLTSKNNQGDMWLFHIFQ